MRTDQAPDASELAAFLREVDQAGFHSAWAMEPQLASSSALEPFSVLSFACAHTTSIRLALAVAVLPLHQPVRLARQVATIDHLSNGRFTLGVGVGVAALPHAAFGVKSSERAPRFEEYLEIMRRLWTEPEVNFEGRFLTLSRGRMEPKPVQQPLPVWFGAGSSAALKRTARMADGWIAAGSSPSSAFPEQAAQLRRYLEEEGRDPDTFPMAKRVYVAIDRPEQEVTDWFRAVYGPAITPEVAVTGSAQEVTEGLQQLQEQGAELVLIAPTGDDRPQLEKIVEHVLPALG